MFRKTILTAATLAVALVAFQPAAQAHGLNIKVGHGHWGHGGGGHGGWGHGGGGHGGWGHGGWGHGGHNGGCYFVKKKKKYWSKKHHHFHSKTVNVKVCY